MIYIYTDGACSNNQSEENFGGWAAILIYGKHQKEISGSEINTTNNRMEMIAVIRALEILKRYDMPIKVFSDSAYIVDCINKKWYINWKKNNWRNAAKKPVLNQDLWEKILFLVDKCTDIDFVKIKGHVNPNSESSLKSSYNKCDKFFLKFGMEVYKKHIEYNNLVDELAVEAAEKLK